MTAEPNPALEEIRGLTSPTAKLITGVDKKFKIKLERAKRASGAPPGLIGVALAGVDDEQGVRRRRMVRATVGEVSCAAVDEAELILLMPVLRVRRCDGPAAAQLHAVDRRHSPDLNLTPSDRRLH